MKLIRTPLLAVAAGLALLLSGCSTVDVGPAGIVNKSTYSKDAAAPVREAQSVTSIIPGAPVDSGRTHTVAPGDTLYNISVRYGVTTKHLAALNAVTDPTQLRIGQVLKLPESTTAPRAYVPNPAVRVNRVTADTQLSVTPPKGALAEEPKAEEPAGVTQATEEQTDAAGKAPAAEPAQPAKTAKTDELPAVMPGSRMIWPVEGRIMSDYGQNGKGIDISGTKGDVVVAAMAGEVIYVGNTVPGYGNLVILKHSPTLVTAYGYNARVTVKTGERVSSGQKIAELGGTAKGAMLRFEVREKGRPINPVQFLPKR